MVQTTGWLVAALTSVLVLSFNNWRCCTSLILFHKTSNGRGSPQCGLHTNSFLSFPLKVTDEGCYTADTLNLNFWHQSVDESQSCLSHLIHGGLLPDSGVLSASAIFKCLFSVSWCHWLAGDVNQCRWQLKPDAWTTLVFKIISTGCTQSSGYWLHY